MLGQTDGGLRLLQLGITAIAFLVFLLHVSTLILQLKSRPTASSFTLIDDVPPRMTALTLCPSAPFSARALLRLGLNATCDTLEDCTKAFLGAQGLPEETALQDLWNASILPLPNYVQSSSIHGIETVYDSRSFSWPYWKVSITSLGSCWTLTPPSQEKGARIQPLSLRINRQTPCSTLLHKTPYIENPRDPFSVCEEVGRICNTSCEESKLDYSLYESFSDILVFLHPPTEPPNIVDSTKTVVISGNIRGDFSFNAWMSVREVRMLESNNCVFDPDYSLSQCLSRCQEEIVGRDLDCIPLQDNSTVPNKACVYQSFIFRQRLLDNLKTGALHAKLVKCESSCKVSCNQMYYSFIIDSTEYYPYGQEQDDRNYLFTVQVSAPYTEYVVEEEIYTLAKFLTDLGGSLGLCFGAGLLTLYQTIYALLVSLFSWRFRDIACFKKDVTGNKMTPHQFYELRLPFKDMWLMCGSCMFLLAFVVHSTQLVVSYLEYPTVFVTNLLTTQAPFPGLTLCPDVPFDLERLSEFGLRAQNESILGDKCLQGVECDRRILVQLIMNKLPGLWDSNLTIGDVWNATRPFDYVADKFAYDDILNDGTVSHTMTTMGVCFTVTPKKHHRDALSLGIFLTDEFRYREQEYSILDDFHYQAIGSFFNVTLILHPEQLSPVYLGENAITFNSENLETVALEVHAITVKRISTPRVSCRDGLYSQKKCTDICLLEERAKEAGCRLPYLWVSKLPLCDTFEEYSQSFKGNDFEVSPANDRKCREGCEIECEKIHYSRKPASLLDIFAGYNPSFSIKKPVVNNIELSEQLKSSPLSFISEIGGIMGLYLGISLLDLISWFICVLQRFVKIIFSIKIKISTHKSRLVQLAWWLFMYLLLAIYSLMRLQDFVINPKVYTSYSEKVNTWKDFPGVTICRWPPFNMTSLVTLGMDFDVEEYCRQSPFSQKYSCKTDLNMLMNDLPGLENVSVAHVWEKASWNLSDILHSYVINDKKYVVESSDSLHWVPLTTSLNRCFNFKPPDDVKEVQELKLHLSQKGYQRRYWFPALPSVKEVLEYAVLSEYGSYRAHNLIRIHPPQDRPVLSDASIDFFAYLEGVNKNYIVTTSLTQVLRLKGVRQDCRDDATYSHFNCFQRCLLEAPIKDHNCKLPFISSSAVDFCNVTSYRTFPKYSDILAQKVDNYAGLKDACMAKCPPDCKSSSYVMRTETKDLEDSVSYPFQHSTVTVFMAESSHKTFEEIPALTWATFIAEVGGVAGILTGMSLLTLCHLIFENLTKFYAYIMAKSDASHQSRSIAWH